MKICLNHFNAACQKTADANGFDWAKDALGVFNGRIILRLDLQCTNCGPKARIIKAKWPENGQSSNLVRWAEKKATDQGLI
jgi:hypothetical protein